MTLNCKAGDLAIMVNSIANNEGRIVKCVRLASASELGVIEGFIMKPTWVTEMPIPWRTLDGGISMYPYAPDNNLRPLRDSDGDDEMIRIAGLPQKKETA